MNGPPLSVGRLDNRRTSLLFKLLLLREHWRRDANRHPPDEELKFVVELQGEKQMIFSVDRHQIVSLAEH